ncbi:MAG: hypothetical protein AAFZ05_13710 [Pseudomonadota bacterium]
MIGRILLTLIAAASALLLVVLALANRHDVRLGLDPFQPDQPALALTLPFFFYLFAALIAGVVIGGMSTWFSQGKWRKTARQRTQDAMRWKGEVDRLTRERDSHVEAAKKLAAQTPSNSAPTKPSLAIAAR